MATDLLPTCDIVCSVVGIKRSAKSRALANALLAIRTERGLTQRAFAEMIDMEQSTWARWETGLRTPTEDRLSDVLDRLGINGDRKAEIIAMAHGTDEPRWLAVSLPDQRAQLSALVDFEASATRIVQVSTLLIPGLLQTSDYIRALMSDAEVPAAELNTRVTVRIGRRDVITRHDPADLLVFIGEGALRQEIGGRGVMTRQLRYVLELAEMPNVEVRVLPFAMGWHAGLEGPFTMIESEGQTVVHVENRRSGLFYHEEEDLDLYRYAVKTMSGEAGADRKKKAMSPGASTELIAEIANEMETTR